MILDGKKASEQIRLDIKEKVSKLIIKPKLVAIQVGNNEASNIYLKMKKKACEEVGISFELLSIPAEIKEEELINKIKDLNVLESITAILVQLPLPKQIDTKKIIDVIDYRKDVDGLTSINAGRLIQGLPSIKPCTALGIINLLKFYNISIESREVTIINRSELVGKPLIPLFLKENATVSILHSKTKDISKYTKKSDIIVVAVGKKDFITKDLVNKSATVIDVGINKEDKLYGDVSFDEVSKVVKNITPVPGGVGVMTVTTLLSNVLECLYLQRK